MKKGLSPILSFMLLVLLGVIVASSIIAWMGTTTKETREGIERKTAEGEISFYIKDVDKGTDSINVTLVNNGRFSIPTESITGYYEENVSDAELIQGSDPIPPGESAKFKMKVN